MKRQQTKNTVLQVRCCTNDYDHSLSPRDDTVLWAHTVCCFAIGKHLLSWLQPDRCGSKVPSALVTAFADSDRVIPPTGWNGAEIWRTLSTHTLAAASTVVNAKLRTKRRLAYTTFCDVSIRYPVCWTRRIP